MTLPTVDQIYLILIIATLVAMCLLVLIFNFKLYLADDDTVLIYTETNYTPKVDESENEVYVVSVIQPVNDVKLKYKLSEIYTSFAQGFRAVLNSAFI